jgi:predicted alpha/beta hydrolase
MDTGEMKTVSTLALTIVTGVGLWFSPALETRLTPGARSERVWDSTRGVELVARVYEHDDKRPIMLVVPPELGSVWAVDRLCAELRQAGFTVISYSHAGVDVPALTIDGKLRWPTLSDVTTLAQALLAGGSFVEANQHGRDIEEARRRDIEALLTTLDVRAPLVPIVLVGYNAGGSALTQLAASSAFISAHPRVKGVIAVESRLWSVYELPPGAEGADAPVLPAFVDKLAALWPKPVFPTGMFPQPALPTLFLESDQITVQKRREGVYAPLLRALPSSNALLIAVEGAGRLDYTDYRAKYPLYALLFHGRSAALWRDEEFVTGTASVMANFATQVLAEPGTPHRKTALSNSSFLAIGGGWLLSNPHYILFP